MSTDQEYWDACLIKAWRRDDTVLSAMRMFSSITGKKMTECNLLRIPNFGFPWKARVRVFVAAYLPKISDWLWDQPPEKDVLLHKKLATSKYNTLEGGGMPRQKEFTKVQYEANKQRKYNMLVEQNIRDRNHATDWNVVKGHARSRRA